MLSDIRCSFPLANEAKARPPPAAARSLLAGEGRCLLARCGPPVPGGAQARSSRTHLRSRGQRFMPNIHQAHPTISVADNAPVLRALPAPCLPGQAACNSLCPNTQKLCAPSLKCAARVRWRLLTVRSSFAPCATLSASAPCATLSASISRSPTKEQSTLEVRRPRQMALADSPFTFFLPSSERAACKARFERLEVYF